MTELNTDSLDKHIEEILDNHAEYYVRQTMKYFQQNGESPALSLNNKGDLDALHQIKSLLLEYSKEQVRLGRIDELERLRFTVVFTDRVMGGGEKTLNLKTLEAYVNLRKVELGVVGDTPAQTKPEKGQ